MTNWNSEPPGGPTTSYCLPDHLPIWVQAPNKPNKAIYQGDAPENATKAQLAALIGLHPAKIIMYRITRRQGERRWVIVILPEELA